MQRIIKWLQKNLKWICLILFVLLVLKCCQSCAKSNEIVFEKQKSEHIIDSLQAEISYRDNLILVYKDTVNVLRNQIANNNTMIESLNADKKNYQRINEQLAKDKRKK